MDAGGRDRPVLGRRQAHARPPRVPAAGLWGRGARALRDRRALVFETATSSLVRDSVGVPQEFSTNLPPLAAAKAALEPEGKWDALWDDLLAMQKEFNTSDAGEVRYPAEYLVTTGTKSS